MEISEFRAILHANFPALAGGKITPIHSGWDSFVFDVDGGDAGRYIFRIPRRPEIQAQHEKEAALLPGLAERLPVSVPRFDFIMRRSQGDDLDLVGYRKIDAQPLDACPRGLGDLAQPLGQFLSALHSLPAGDAAGLGLPAADAQGWRQIYVCFYEWLQQNLFPRLSDQARQYTASLWENFLNSPAKVEFQCTLIHGDLAPEHILVNNDCTQVTGVIDWEDACLGDPALDFAGLYWLGGQPFVERVLESYSLPTGRTFWPRIRFYADIGPYHEARFAIETGNQPHLEHALSEIGKRSQAIRNNNPTLSFLS